jgi:diketogulonate reductase-like aldo/keto reductase
MLSIERQQAIPTIGYGTWNLSGNIEEIMENAVLAGYRYFDCTAVYGNEARLGNALKNILSDTSKFKVNREDVKIHRFSIFIT